MISLWFSHDFTICLVDIPWKSPCFSHGTAEFHGRPRLQRHRPSPDSWLGRPPPQGFVWDWRRSPRKLLPKVPHVCCHYHIYIYIVIIIMIIIFITYYYYYNYLYTIIIAIIITITNNYYHWYYCCYYNHYYYYYYYICYYRCYCYRYYFYYYYSCDYCYCYWCCCCYCYYEIFIDILLKMMPYSNFFDAEIREEKGGEGLEGG